jgi:hypothetical protein
MAKLYYWSACAWASHISHDVHTVSAVLLLISRVGSHHAPMHAVQQLAQRLAV